MPGPGARARGELALAVLERRLQRLGLDALEHRAELIGVNAMHGPALGADREPYEVRVRLAVRTTTRDAGRAGGTGGGSACTSMARPAAVA